jgi:hypothetical protein
MNKKTISTVIWIGFVSLIAIPIIVLTMTWFIIPFYNIIYKHISTVPFSLRYIFDVWIAHRDWSFLSAIGAICAGHL